MSGKTDKYMRKAFSGEPIDFCPVIDAHVHLGECFSFPYFDGSLESVIATMDRIGVDAACASGQPGLFVNAEVGNDVVLEAMRLHPDRIFGYATVDIGHREKIVPELEKRLEQGFIGIKIMSLGIVQPMPYDHKNYQLVFQFAAAHRLPVLAHTFTVAELKHLEKSFGKFKKAKFILAHAGSCGAAPYVRLAKKYDNVFIETCYSAAPKGLIETFAAKKIVDKVLWGSDMNFMSAEQQIGRVLFAQISGKDKKRILGGNALKILNLER